jgi:hypothetical protein
VSFLITSGTAHSRSGDCQIVVHHTFGTPQVSMKTSTIIRNMFITVLLCTILVGYDIAHTPKPSVVFAEAPLDTTTHITSIETTVWASPPVKKQITQDIIVKVSHYWPDLGGVNCLTFKNGHCQSHMANGEDWEDWEDKAIACPPELKLGTKIKILGKVWICKDRGSKIQMDGDAYWVDMLTRQTVVAYGQLVPAVIIK